MSMVMYIEPEWLQEYDRLWSLIEKTKKAMSEWDGEEAESLHKELDNLYNELYGKFYFSIPYNPYGLPHWLDVNVGQRVADWELANYQPSPITSVESLKKELSEIESWIKVVEPMKTSGLWVTEACEDWSRVGLQTRNTNGLEEKLIQLPEETTQCYKRCLNKYKEFISEAIESVSKGGRVVVERL